MLLSEIVIQGVDVDGEVQRLSFEYLDVEQSRSCLR